MPEQVHHQRPSTTPRLAAAPRGDMRRQLSSPDGLMDISTSISFQPNEAKCVIKLKNREGQSGEFVVQFNDNGKVFVSAPRFPSGPMVLWPGAYSANLERKVDLRASSSEMSPEAYKWLSKEMAENSRLGSEQIQKVLNQAFIMGASARILLNIKDTERCIFNPNTASKLNTKGANGLYPTFAQNWYAANPTHDNLPCNSFARTMSLISVRNTGMYSKPFDTNLVKDLLPQVIKLACKSPGGEYKIHTEMTGKLNGKRHSEEFNGRFNFYRPDMFQYLDSGVEAQLKGLKGGSTVYLGKTHTGIVVEPGKLGGLMGWGGSNPIVKHVIGSELRHDQIQEIDYNGRTWLGLQYTVKQNGKDVEVKWPITAIVEPDAKYAWMSKGSEDFDKRTCEVLFTKTDPRGGFATMETLKDAATWLQNHSPTLCVQNETYIIKALMTLNPDRVSKLNSTLEDFRIMSNMPLRIPNAWLADSMISKSRTGVISGRSLVVS